MSDFANIVATLVRLLSGEKATQEKSWEAAVPLAIEIVRALTKEKGFSVGGSVSTLLGGGGFGAEFKGWEAAVPLAIEIVRAMTKGQQQTEEKIFGIDDAILIPAVASVVVAALK